MTKVTDLKKPISNNDSIVFAKCYGCTDGKWTTSTASPRVWDNIILLEEKWKDGYDLMFAWDDTPNTTGYLYLGYFNSGKVE